MKKVLLFLVMTSIILGTSSCTKLPTGDSVSHVTLDKESLGLFVGEEAMLKPTVHPLTVSQSVSWQSDNNAVAVVDANGKVRGVSSGSTIIRATSVSGGRAGSCKVTVSSDYIENGVDYGHGIRFAGKVWAPVNCGYEPANSGKGILPESITSGDERWDLDVPERMRLERLQSCRDLFLSSRQKALINLS